MYHLSAKIWISSHTWTLLQDDSEAVQMPPSATRQASDYGQVLENQTFVSEPRKEVDIGSILAVDKSLYSFVYSFKNRKNSLMHCYHL